jgi:hypothetical protein
VVDWLGSGGDESEAARVSNYFSLGGAGSPPSKH